MRPYYSLTKPGIIYGNLVTATAGFLLASKVHFNLGLLVALLAGMSLVIASACVFNNYFDREIDQKMIRTKRRALVIGTISTRAAITYATILGVLGFTILIKYTNGLTVGIGLIAIFSYVVLYGLAKRRSVHGTVVGSIAGAAPPVAGYVSVTNHLDSAAVLLFVIMVCWQMPHFYSIAIYRLKDYKNAGLPVLPVKKGIQKTKIQIVLYILAFLVASLLLTFLHYTGKTYFVVVGALGLTWLWRGLSGFMTSNSQHWARQMFFFSLAVTLSLSIMLSIGAHLP